MIDLQDIQMAVGSFALEGIGLSVDQGQYGVLMGKTGSGKTTLLEAVAGLKPVQGGRIVLGGRDVTHLKPAERNLGYVPQDGALFPTMTVRSHLSFALETRRIQQPAIENRVAELAELLGIGHLLDRKPVGLSGGEQQRVALGRALSFKPPVLLLDEPLSALDEETRQQMYDVLRRVREATGVTTLHVTHSVDEAHALSDVLFHLESGGIRRKEAEGTPQTTNDREHVT
ncbi:MAG: ABC transporter ATP-binding protein [Phycisphaerae bacterium]|nr:ABC transporter ATP-binding protein [Phycisphaerae bacterium]